MYGIQETTQELEFKPVINAGIQENVTLAKVAYEPFKEGSDPVIRFYFTNESGAELIHTLWDVNEEQIRNFHNPERVHNRNNVVLGFVAGTPVTEEDAIKMERDLFSRVALHLASNFISKEELVKATSGASSYDMFAKAYVPLFTEEALAAGNPIRLKVVYNSRNYSTLPKYPPFIESMKIPKAESILSIGKWDRVEKVEASADDATSFNPSELEW